MRAGQGAWPLQQLSVYDVQRGMMLFFLPVFLIVQTFSISPYVYIPFLCLVYIELGKVASRENKLDKHSIKYLTYNIICCIV